LRTSGLVAVVVVDFSGDLFYESDVLFAPSFVAGAAAVVAGFLLLGNNSSTVLP